MSEIEFKGVKLELDEDGFLQDPSKWNNEVAEFLAKGEGIEQLTDEHWRVIHYLRDYYMKYQIAPMIRQLVKATNLELKYIYKLFPAGPAKGACKVAGLPKPTGCV